MNCPALFILLCLSLSANARRGNNANVTCDDLVTSCDISWPRMPAGWFSHVRLLWPRSGRDPAASLLPRRCLQGEPRAAGHRGQVLHGGRAHTRGQRMQGDVMTWQTMEIHIIMPGNARSLCRGIQMQEWEVSGRGHCHYRGVMEESIFRNLYLFFFQEIKSSFLACWCLKWTKGRCPLCLVSTCLSPRYPSFSICQ